MRNLAYLGSFCALALVTVAAVAQQAEPAPKAPAGLNIVVYQADGVPVTVHLHGAAGDVHVWVVREQAEVKAAVEPDKQKLDAIKRLFPEKK